MNCLFLDGLDLERLEFLIEHLTLRGCQINEGDRDVQLTHQIHDYALVDWRDLRLDNIVND